MLNTTRITMPPTMEVGKLIRKARKAAGLTQPELAERCGWGYRQARISHYESGRNSPGIEELETIAAALGMSLSEFFAEQPMKANPKGRIPALAQKLADLPPDRQKLILQLIDAIQVQ